MRRRLAAWRCVLRGEPLEAFSRRAVDAGPQMSRMRLKLGPGSKSGGLKSLNAQTLRVIRQARERSPERSTTREEIWDSTLAVSGQRAVRAAAHTNTTASADTATRSTLYEDARGAHLARRRRAPSREAQPPQHEITTILTTSATGSSSDRAPRGSSWFAGCSSRPRSNAP